VSIGVYKDELLLDLDYSEDSKADVDMNVVMVGNGEFVEVQGTAEGRTFSRDLLNRQLELAEGGIRELMTLQAESLGDHWPLDKKA